MHHHYWDVSPNTFIFVYVPVYVPCIKPPYCEVNCLKPKIRISEQSHLRDDLKTFWMELHIVNICSVLNCLKVSWRLRFVQKKVMKDKFFLRNLAFRDIFSALLDYLEIHMGKAKIKIFQMRCQCYSKWSTSA